jgi:hypothetical protein
MVILSTVFNQTLPELRIFILDEPDKGFGISDDTQNSEFVHYHTGDMGGQWENRGPSAMREEFPGRLGHFLKRACGTLRPCNTATDRNWTAIIPVKMDAINLLASLRLHGPEGPVSSV